MYRRLLEVNNLTAADKVIYSYLIYKSIANIDDVYDYNGVLQQSKIIDFFDDNGDDLFAQVNNVSITKISTSVGFSDVKCWESLTTLRKLNLLHIGDDYSYEVRLFRDIVLDYGFLIDLSIGKLTNVNLLYFYLKDKSRPYNGNLDTWCSKLAKEFNVKVKNLHQMLYRLRDRGLIEILEDNKLKIN